MFNPELPEYRCPFCRLLAGERTPHDDPNDIVWQTELVTAKVASRWWPNPPGHLLVFPNTHYENLYDLPRRYGHAVHDMIRDIARAMRQAYSCQGIEFTRPGVADRDRPQQMLPVLVHGDVLCIDPLPHGIVPRELVAHGGLAHRQRLHPLPAREPRGIGHEALQHEPPRWFQNVGDRLEAGDLPRLVSNTNSEFATTNTNRNDPGPGTSPCRR